MFVTRYTGLHGGPFARVTDSTWNEITGAIWWYELKLNMAMETETIIPNLSLTYGFSIAFFIC